MHGSVPRLTLPDLSVCSTPTPSPSPCFITTTTTRAALPCVFISDSVLHQTKVPATSVPV
ncbi:hypothetical protein E2C01_063092 [Portunus trituberculatus]|uniref:Uncharacterized protein n=1 Tax=Portunus trituberculatus TaxID=210409 RepID=A0A5B7HCT1_PORTR|nr:hypothetical protein [Portunus trituberculatus]